MYICQRCKQEINPTEQPDAERRFPAFTVAAGVLGTLGAAVTGSLLLVPAAIVVGAAADGQRCDLCGEEIDDPDMGYRLMDAVEDEFGGHTYRPVQGTNPQKSSPQNALSGKSTFTPGFRQPTDPSGEVFSFDEPEESKPPESLGEFIYDDIERKMVSREVDQDPLASDPMWESQTPDSIVPDTDSLLETPLETDIGQSGPFEDLTDDLGDVSFEPFDEPFGETAL